MINFLLGTVQYFFPCVYVTFLFILIYLLKNIKQCILFYCPRISLSDME